MHFPTSLPPTSGSPALRFASYAGGLHSDGADKPRLRKPIVLDSLLRSHTPQPQPNIRRLAVPVYGHNHTEFALPGVGPRIPRGLTRKSAINLQVVPTAEGERNLGPVPPTSSDGGPSVSGVDGAGKFFQNAEAKAKSKLKSMRSREIRKMFAKKPHESDPEDSPTEAAEFNEMKKKKAKGKKSNLLEPEMSDKEAESPRAVLAAHFRRTRGKDIETGLELDDADHHPIVPPLKRMDEQRKRKMRRFKGIGRNKAKDVPEPKSPSMEHGPEDRERLAESVQRKLSLTEAKDQVEAYRFSQMQEKGETEDFEGSRVGNAMRRTDDRFRSNEAENQAGSRRASWTQTSSSGDTTRRNSQQPEFVNNSISSAQNPHRSGVPAVLTPPNLQHNQLPPTENTQKLSQVHVVQPEVPLYGSVRERPIIPYNKPIYPPRPPPPFYRPTLSPVSSRSPAPTSTVVAASGSPKAPQPRDQSIPVSEPVRKKKVIQDPSGSTHLPQPEISSSGSPIPISLTPAGLTVRNGVPISQESSALGSARLSPIIESSSPGPEPPRRSAMKSARSTNESKNVQVLSKEPNTNGEAEAALKAVAFQTPTRNSSTLQNISSNGTVSSAQFSEIKRPRSPPPTRTPSPLKIPARTPTTSALEFWREADESLHPSESASAQPPNYRGEPPPTFWKDADKMLGSQKPPVPTMEEWIATLPGLGLGLGPWGSADGALDLKYFQNLKGRKLQKKNSIRSVKTQELIEESMKEAEKAIGEIDEDGLTPEEAEALESDGDDKVAAANQPPPIANPRLLHPSYTPGPIPDLPKSFSPRPMSSANPQGRLGKDVATRLTELERYWNEQNIAMGTVLKRMLVVVDSLIVKEREESQRRARREQMGWADSDDETEEIKSRRDNRKNGQSSESSEWGCRVA